MEIIVQLLYLVMLVALILAHIILSEVLVYFDMPLAELTIILIYVLLFLLSILLVTQSSFPFPLFYFAAWILYSLWLYVMAGDYEDSKRGFDFYLEE